MTGVSRPGVRIVSFAPMLKHGLFPLATILEKLVRAGEDALGIPVEIEFAVRLPSSLVNRPSLAFCNSSAGAFARSEDLSHGRCGAAERDLPEQQGPRKRTHRESV